MTERTEDAISLVCQTVAWLVIGATVCALALSPVVALIVLVRCLLWP